MRSSSECKLIPPLFFCVEYELCLRVLKDCSFLGNRCHLKLSSLRYSAYCFSRAILDILWLISAEGGSWADWVYYSTSCCIFCFCLFIFFWCRARLTVAFALFCAKFDRMLLFNSKRTLLLCFPSSFSSQLCVLIVVFPVKWGIIFDCFVIYFTIKRTYSMMLLLPIREPFSEHYIRNTNRTSLIT